MQADNFNNIIAIKLMEQKCYLAILVRSCLFGVQKKFKVNAKRIITYSNIRKAYD